ncbi:hypothetical protein B0H66DRAFT_361814 [Apodospora peruviana]|uniref:Cytoplasmic tRNA 2-thiolation protein 2 n=1 Tax=Apodospora peruviana TaxID=516989 RepID=A0AAE0LZM7_9PEZI|nr:hypothetical protein B0H66DRAFT_361814 [Apodospora peruviana]
MQQPDTPSSGVASGGAAPPAPASLCVKCHLHEATLDSRSQRVCSDCFTKFISAKCIKQVGIIGKDIRNPGTGAASQKKKYLLGLSLGVSSSVLVHLLNENVEYQLAKGRNAPFDLVIVHVDSSGLYPSSSSPGSVQETLEGYRKRYPRFEFRLVPLSAVLDLDTVDWRTLILPSSAVTPPENEQQLHALFFDRLSSPTSRADILRLFTRHLLISSARTESCHALLLGHTTTALAELTLAETAKGRGFSLPWQVNDGPVAVVSHSTAVPTEPITTTTTPTSQSSNATTTTTESQIQVYHPLRDLLRKELVIYATELMGTPSLASDLNIMIPNHPSSATQQAAAAVVSHKDLSIEEVMFRYFAEVEENYPSVVANVARTTGKLVRLLGGDSEPATGSHSSCGMCTMPLDEQGDERWRGELGDEDVEDDMTRSSAGRICYGCERSIRG